MRRRLITVVIVLLVSWGGLAVTLALGVTPRLGLDLQGGTSVILTAPAGTDPEVVDVAVEIMRSRIEDFGIQEPEISVTSDRTVLVQLPGVTNPERALDAIGQTGELSFRPVEETFGADQNPFAPPTTTTAPPTGPTTTRPGTPTTVLGDTSTSAPEATSTTAPEVTSTTAASLGVPAGLQATTTTVRATTTSAGPTTTTSAGSSTTTVATPTTIPEGVDPDTGLTIDDDPEAEAWLPQIAPEVGTVAIYHVGPAGLLGSDVADAIPGFQGTGATQGGWVVQLDLTAEGADQFAEMTRQAAAFPQLDPRRQIAIVLDGEVISAPEVSLDVDPATGITGGEAIITVGGDDPAAAEQEAQDLSVVLRYGSLPVAFEQSSVQTVSATLGTDSLRAGLIAGLVGLAVVALYILIYYRALGLVGVIGLSVFGSLLITIFSLLGTYRGLDPHPRRRYRDRHLDRDNGRLVHRPLRADQRRGPQRTHRPLGRRGRLPPRLPYRDHRRHGVADRRCPPLLPRYRAGAGLRPGARYRDPARHRGRLPLHTECDRAVIRHRSGSQRRGWNPCHRRVRGGRQYLMGIRA